MNEKLAARLVYDGGDEVHIPPEMGTPRHDQMQGTPAERLTEIAGRVCYDSLGKGRPSFTVHCKAGCNDGLVGEKQTVCQECGGRGRIEGFHDHILAVKHGSVLEHFNFTVEIPIDKKAKEGRMAPHNRRRMFVACCANHPGVITGHAKNALRITVNLRSVIQWLSWEQSLYGRITSISSQLAFALHHIGHKLAPHIIAPPVMGNEPYVVDEFLKIRLVEPKSPHEQWITLFLVGSRGFSHELVRHGDFTAISQRSTRYVDESETDWIEHPLTTAYTREEQAVADDHCDDVSYRINERIDKLNEDAARTIESARVTYRNRVRFLEDWLAGKGIDKLTARKQARGAARGYLGNALSTELIFSASIAQWKWMINQRGCAAADAEIREVFAQALPELKRSRYGEAFAIYELQPSPDGIGQVIVDTSKELVAA